MANGSSLLTGRMPMMGSRDPIPTLLRGLGAAATGQVPQFRQQMVAEQQLGSQMALQDIQMKDVLEKSAAQDAVRVRGLIGANNIRAAIELLQDRVDLESRLGVSSDDTLSLIQQIQSNPMAAVPTLDAAIDSAYQIGLIALPQLSDRQRLEIQAQQADWNSARDSIRDVMEENNKLAADAVTGFNKLESLAGFIRKAQDEGATDIQKRSGRQAAATILTIMARMASPGVVTDRDFANQAGGQSLQAGVIDYIRNLGQTDLQTASLLAQFDPTNPDLIDVDALVNQARGLITGQTPSVLRTYASQKQRAMDYNPSQTYLKAEFGGSSAQNIRDLANISLGPAFDAKAYFDNPTQYMEQQQGSMTPASTSAPAATTSDGIFRFTTEQAAIEFAQQNSDIDPSNIRVIIGNELVPLRPKQ